MFDDLIEIRKRYLIKVLRAHGDFYVDNVVLKGEKDELLLKLKSPDYVKSLGIDESILSESFELIRLFL